MKGQFAQRRPQGAKAQVLNERTFRAPEKIFWGFFIFCPVFVWNFQNHRLFAISTKLKTNRALFFLGLLGLKG
jgi:hypothetical protein